METRYRTPTARWSAVRRRDPRADAWFRYAVRTTGVYCRPSCPSRPARRENVSFHDSAAAAEAAGFRPCKRCEPREVLPRARRTALVQRLCRSLEQASPPPTLASLAREAHLSPFHLQRLFRAATGVSPREYAQASRRRRLAERLTAGGPVTRALHEVGYGSAARAYAEAPEALGMTPRQYAEGGAGLPVWHAVADCTLGKVLVAASARGVCTILLGDDAQALRGQLAARLPRARLEAAGREFEATLAAVVRLVEQPALSLPLPLDIQGTAFQQRVWQALREIPPGETLSYAQLAARIGAPRATRAVAAACAANALAVAVPCHRILRGDGSLSGYRWGPERKRELLRREGVALKADGPLPRRG